MVSRGEEKYVVYPVYFDKTVSRLKGRRVSSKYAVEKPYIDDILKAAKSLGLNPILEKETFHSSRPYRQEGRILIDKKDSKNKLLIQIAKVL
jgi:signal recognition particle subunit SRP19